MTDEIPPDSERCAQWVRFRDDLRWWRCLRKQDHEEYGHEVGPEGAPPRLTRRAVKAADDD